MKYLHTMVRVTDLDQSVKFFCDVLGFTETRRYESEQGRFTLVFVAPDESPDCPVELTYNWDPEEYDEGRNFGHLAYAVDNIYEYCQMLMDKGVTINRPPRDGAWRSSARRTTSPSSFCKRATRSKSRNRGSRWKTSASGETSHPPLRKSASSRLNSSGFSKCTVWAQPGTTARLAPGMVRHSCSICDQA
jgi:lactoylglutathione lyase